MNFNGGHKFELGFEIDPAFRDQNVLSPNIVEGRREEGPIRYGVFKTTNNIEN